MKVVLEKRDWEEIARLILEDDNDNGTIYYSDIDVRICYKINVDSYYEEDTDGYIIRDADCRITDVTHDIFEIDYKDADIEMAENVVESELVTIKR